jgi:hypothetical protein
MEGKIFFSEQAAAGWLLILSGLIFLVGGILYTGRAIWKWPAAEAPSYLRWERGFVIAALLTSVLGLVLLERMLEAAGDRILAPSGMVIFLLGAAVVIFAETFFLSRQEWIYTPTVVFVVLAFLAQAAFGAALLRTGLLPGWVGWATILWNLGWLVVLPIARPQNMYYPWLHYVAPVLIGIALLRR